MNVTTLGATILVRTRVVECSNSNDNIHENAKNTLKIVGFCITQEVTDNQNSQYEDDSVEDLKVQIHRHAKSPANHNNKRSVKERRLDGAAEDMRQC